MDCIPVIILCQHHTHMKEIKSASFLSKMIKSMKKIVHATRRVAVVTHDVIISPFINTSHWFWYITALPHGAL